jgi:hypothetical protein
VRRTSAGGTVAILPVDLLRHVFTIRVCCCLQLQRVREVNAKVTLVNFVAYKDTKDVEIQCKVEEEVAPPPKLTQVPRVLRGLALPHFV